MYERAYIFGTMSEKAAISRVQAMRQPIEMISLNRAV